MPKVTRRGRPPHDDLLTPAEWSVVHAVQHGLTNREIAERRGISVDGVKFHVENAVAKSGVGGRKQLRQWFRAPKQSLLRHKGKAVTTPLILGQIGQISRSVKNIEQAVTWYGSTLGLRHLYTYGKFAFFDCGGIRLFLTAEGDASATESVLYLVVQDIEDAYTSLRSRGIEFINAPHLIHKQADGTEEWMAFFKDPDGRSLALMAQVKPQ